MDLLRIIHTYFIHDKQIQEVVYSTTKPKEFAAMSKVTFSNYDQTSKQYHQLDVNGYTFSPSESREIVNKISADHIRRTYIGADSIKKKYVKKKLHSPPPAMPWERLPLEDRGKVPGGNDTGERKRGSKGDSER